MDAFSACGRRFSDGKPFAKPSENGGQNVEFSAGAGRGRRIWHDMARIAGNCFPHRKTVWRVAVEKPCPPGKTGSFTPFPQSFPHPAEGDFFTGKIAECAAFFRFSPHRLSTPFHNFSTTCGKLCGNCGKRTRRTGERGGAWRYVVPLSNGDPACRRPAWGGVRLCGNVWISHIIFSGRCRYDEVICSEMTRGGQGRDT